MTKVGIRELKNRLSEYVGRVRKGKIIVITDRGEQVAKIVPMEKQVEPEDAIEARLQELAAAGHLRLPLRPKRPLPPFRPVKAKGKPASRMIIEDRR
jgi:prevent-host-death family protein